MKLWIIRRLDHVGYDEHDAFVVRAETEDEARIFASKEGYGWDWSVPTQCSTCVELTYEGVAGIVLGSFNAG